ncbi:cell division control protein 14 [Blastocladiella emersonii ATCC 22665]|nr:cell division control protein 14 [Blastocladiella emersonii ATCC 22665]
MPSYLSSVQAGGGYLADWPKEHIKHFIPGRLGFTSTNRDLAGLNSTSAEYHYFTIDHVLVYIPFFADFGPPNMSHLYRFICLLDAKLKDPQLAAKTVVLYSSNDNGKRANAAYLISAYMMVMHHQEPEEAFSPLFGLTPPLTPFRDAGSGPPTYFLSVVDCLKGLYRAMAVGLFSFADFDLEEYEKHEKVEFGDFNWLSAKFLAFASPTDNPRAPYPATAMADYFARKGVVTVVRLNNKLYDKSVFTRRGIEHVEMYFPDGSCPTDPILHRFLDLAESRNGPLAVHCKAGLGRTGSLIAAYYMKHHFFTASEVIGFLRIMRPGSVVGPQQNWLHAKQKELHSMLATMGTAATRGLTASPAKFAAASAEQEAEDAEAEAAAAVAAAESLASLSYGGIPNQPRKVHDPNDPLSVVSSAGRYHQRSVAATTARSRTTPATAAANSPAPLSVSTVAAAGGSYAPSVPSPTYTTATGVPSGKPATAWGGSVAAAAVPRAASRVVSDASRASMKMAPAATPAPDAAPRRVSSRQHSGTGTPRRAGQ